MKTYRQTYIPEVNIQTHGNLVSYMKEYYSKHIQGTTIVNKHIGLTIYFGSEGKSELAYGHALYAEKAALVQCLPILLQVAEYNNWGERKTTDPLSVFGYANFKAKAKINGKLVNVRITVKVKCNGKGYYNHEISIKK